MHDDDTITNNERYKRAKAKFFPQFPQENKKEIIDGSYCPVLHLQRFLRKYGSAYRKKAAQKLCAFFLPSQGMKQLHIVHVITS